MKRHGGLLVDEMKLSAHLDMKSSTHIQGFVDLRQFTNLSAKHTKTDHGLVVMFQPLVGSWAQMVRIFVQLNFYFKLWSHNHVCHVLKFSAGVFASSRNLKSRMLTKIGLEATVPCE